MPDASCSVLPSYLPTSLRCSLQRTPSIFFIRGTHIFSPLHSACYRLPTITSRHLTPSCKSLQHKPIPTQQYGHWHSLHSTQQHAAQQHPPATPKSNSAPNMQFCAQHAKRLVVKKAIRKTPAPLHLLSQRTKNSAQKKGGPPIWAARLYFVTGGYPLTVSLWIREPRTLRYRTV